MTAEMKLETEETFGRFVAIGSRYSNIDDILSALMTSMGWVPWCSETRRQLTLLTNLMLAWLALIRARRQ
ncbi:hypothetical protein O9992_21220 [Vibrio lentus]|nr:hypothetical protein [Vibrio lentus]